MLTSGSMNSSTRNCLIHLCVTVSLILAGVYCMPGLYGLGRRLLTTMAAEYKAGTHSVVFVTVPNVDVGKTLSRGLLEKKLAACVNLIPGLISMYEWEGKMEEDSEMLMKIKTRSSRVDEISEYIRQHHPYDVAEVISVPIENGNPPYLEWLGKNVPEK